ncbi:MAG: DUF309 domain-containing protein [Actinomycetota bacterium]|nr:DUF309 domain-containing protein [Actinomycetota bacterium]
MRDLNEATGKTGVPSPTRRKPERPRDRLGRPMDWGATNELELEDYDSMTLEQNHEVGREHMRARRFFPAHEAWETAWKQARGTDDAEFFKGLSQMGAGYVHLLRGNAHGAKTLLRRASRRVKQYPEGHHGIATGALHDKLEADAAAVEAGDMVPAEDVTFDPPVV